MAAATAVAHWVTAAVAMVTCEEQQVRKRGVETAEEQFGCNLLLKTCEVMSGKQCCHKEGGK